MSGSGEIAGSSRSSLTIEKTESRIANTTFIAEHLGLEPADVWLGLESLTAADYFTWHQRMSGGRNDISLTQVRLLERGRVELEQWPTAGMDALIDILDDRIADERDPEAKSKLVALRDTALSMGREVVTSILSDLAKKTMGGDK